MRLAALLFALSVPVGVRGQELAGAERQRVLEAARGRYYSLTGLGVRSFTCAVHFDLGTISRGMLPETDTADRALLQSAAFSLTVTPKGPTLRYEFPQGSVSQSQETVAGVTLWITEIVRSFFEVWPARGFNGPIPAERQVQSLTRDGEGYRVTAKVAGGTSEIRMSGGFLVEEIVTREREGEVDEQPTFAGSANGLVFSGGRTVTKEAAGVTQVKYEIEQAPAGGVLLPRSVHLAIGSYVDVRFGLGACSVVRR